MIKHYHNKAARRARKRLCDKERGYIGDSRHRRRIMFAKAVSHVNGDCSTIRELAEEFWGNPENVASFFAEAATLDEQLARKRRGSNENE